MTDSCLATKPTLNITQQRQQIRRQMRAKRQQLSAEQQQQAAENICRQALALIAQCNAETVALYLAFNGEISTALLIEKLWQAEKTVCLPRLHPFTAGHLLFFRYDRNSLLQPNQFAIPEPTLDLTRLVPQNELEIIFTPLVAFDRQGNRLGMGGGFYDRTLQHLQQKNVIAVGLAHQCQQVNQLPIEHWDVPLSQILVG
ncbi:5-formyltetrahydrofolate cyclo-ligase [Testudinibacter sp. TR-2022]|uniref:5-formyltetrahydrofolate cyclo-ligase n=1 Tax=Testudinibacter sp. TR-2022 TaxID=2585029 RepID=UPI00111A4F5F|nr:5-formyltetrahydrofolate cyclo-ligase [Testudinibacter sp. TR-2022]TNH00777.1 5-formyltetrahydrofolate cyclo-ligase [Pasteurellaceae bacterium Phil31]TNH09600.1 5-formyltetrahydrofolate cyclo-ligase [Testudinibacter sp. TR-2022]TNH13072.1 5-formyltetrahydrofolate cyclo-ligase [Testudinibacter sp. TR-2022]TNH13200.1 5-formyltetrahydrofolate cyclo-ligase [Testudinibacter sp. TR-2022]TNH18443.1 5-formyltetrahydrofolate cyclo-ligase [Testudinibacter sp. TR-2022]